MAFRRPILFPLPDDPFASAYFRQFLGKCEDDDRFRANMKAIHVIPDDVVTMWKRLVPVKLDANVLAHRKLTAPSFVCGLENFHISSWFLPKFGVENLRNSLQPRL